MGGKESDKEQTTDRRGTNVEDEFSNNEELEKDLSLYENFKARKVKQTHLVRRELEENHAAGICRQHHEGAIEPRSGR